MRQTARLWVLVLCAFLGVSALGYWYLHRVPADGGASELERYTTLPDFKPTDRVTVVSPHLDDETIGVGGLISRLRRQGVEVSVIFMTNGDDNPIGADLQFGTGYATPERLIQSGVARQDEALRALAVLGVPQADTYFLGLPDRGLRALDSPRYAADRYRAPGTLRDASPYQRTYVPDLPYTGDSVRAALAKAVNATAPTYLLTTPTYDKHSDHAATASFVSEVLPKLAPVPRVYYFLVHYRGFPNPRGVSTELYLVPPKALRDLPWQVVPLAPEDEAAKGEAVNAYASQLRIPFLGSLMRGMVRKNELVVN